MFPERYYGVKIQMTDQMKIFATCVIERNELLKKKKSEKKTNNPIETQVKNMNRQRTEKKDYKIKRCSTALLGKRKIQIKHQRNGQVCSSHKTL